MVFVLWRFFLLSFSGAGGEGGNDGKKQERI